MADEDDVADKDDEVDPDKPDENVVAVEDDDDIDALFPPWDPPVEDMILVLIVSKG
jgi:hypothetical protein